MSRAQISHVNPNNTSKYRIIICSVYIILGHELVIIGIYVFGYFVAKFLK